MKRPLLFFIILVILFIFPNEARATEFTPTLKYTLAKVVIRVVNAANNQGIAGASVSLSAQGYSSAAGTNQSGEALVNDIPVPGGAYRNITVTCSAAGYSSATKTIVVRDSASPQYFTVALSNSSHESPPPISGDESRHTHDTPLDKPTRPLPEYTYDETGATAPQPAKDTGYAPGINSRKFKPRKKKEETQFVEKRGTAAGAGATASNSGF